MLGMEPGIRSSNVPGRDVGYMPQVCNALTFLFLYVFTFAIVIIIGCWVDC